MFTVEEACMIMENEFPNKRIVGCLNCSDVYAFDMVSREWNGDPLDSPTGSTLETIDKKTGKRSTRHIDDILEDLNVERVDIEDYLSEADVEFIKKLNN